MTDLRLLEVSVEDNHGYDFHFGHRTFPVMPYTPDFGGRRAASQFTLTGLLKEIEKPWRTIVNYKGDSGCGSDIGGSAIKHDYILQFKSPKGAELRIKSDLEGNLEDYNETSSFVLDGIGKYVYSNRIHLPLSFGNIVLLYGVTEPQEDVRPKQLDMWGMSPIQLRSPNLVS